MQKYSPALRVSLVFLGSLEKKVTSDGFAWDAYIEGIEHRAAQRDLNFLRLQRAWRSVWFLDRCLWTGCTCLSCHNKILHLGMLEALQPLPAPICRGHRISFTSLWISCPSYADWNFLNFFFNQSLWHHCGLGRSFLKSVLILYLCILAASCLEFTVPVEFL